MKVCSLLAKAIESVLQAKAFDTLKPSYQQIIFGLTASLDPADEWGQSAVPEDSPLVQLINRLTANVGPSRPL